MPLGNTALVSLPCSGIGWEHPWVDFRGQQLRPPAFGGLQGNFYSCHNYEVSIQELRENHLGGKHLDDQGKMVFLGR